LTRLFSSKLSAGIRFGQSLGACAPGRDHLARKGATKRFPPVCPAPVFRCVRYANQLCADRISSRIRASPTLSGWQALVVVPTELTMRDVLTIAFEATLVTFTFVLLAMLLNGYAGLI
jgi:hypothetical protein